MSRPALSRILVTTLLVLALTVPSARAGEATSPHIRGGAGFYSLVDLLHRAWGGLVSLWMKNGCSLDPSGGCAAAPTLDNGCIADPHGGCAAAPTQDNGCIADPSGRCL